MVIHAWAELPQMPGQPEYLTVTSDARGFHIIEHYASDPPSQRTTPCKSLEIAMIKFAFAVSGHYPLPTYDEIIGQTKKEELS